MPAFHSSRRECIHFKPECQNYNSPVVPNLKSQEHMLFDEFYLHPNSHPMCNVHLWTCLWCSIKPVMGCNNWFFFITFRISFYFWRNGKKPKIECLLRRFKCQKWNMWGTGARNGTSLRSFQKRYFLMIMWENFNSVCARSEQMLISNISDILISFPCYPLLLDQDNQRL